MRDTEPDQTSEEPLSGPIASRQPRTRKNPARDALRGALGGPQRTRTGETTNKNKGLIRYTIDLDERQHRMMRMFAAGQGRNGVRSSVVIRSLLEELNESAELAERVSARIESLQ